MLETKQRFTRFFWVLGHSDYCLGVHELQGDIGRIPFLAFSPQATPPVTGHCTFYCWAGVLHGFVLLTIG